MKLLQKTGLYYLLAAIIMYAIGSVAFYRLLQYQLRKDAIEKIYEDKTRLLRNIARFDSLSNIVSADDAVAFSPIAVTDTVIEQLKDTEQFESSDSEMNTYLKLQFKGSTRNASYRVILTKSLAERENLIAAIAWSFLSLMGLFVIGLFFINRWVSKKVWGPFYSILHQLRNFNVEKGNYSTAATNITEFKELNATLDSMTRKVKNDYRNLKEFTENASHEIQTPLAGIRSKVELMMQNEDLDENQVHQLAGINESVNRLSRLNQSLLLLSKIENEQFSQTEPVGIRDVLEKHLDNLRELAQAKNLRFNTELAENPKVHVHPFLLDILLSNLLMNAIRHNIDAGFIYVKLDNSSLSIENSGKELKIATEDLFNRFKKGDDAGDSIGVGLSIVRKICDISNIRIDYTSSENTHLITLHF